MQLEAIKFAKILKLTGDIAETLGYGKDGLQFLSWAETLDGDEHLTNQPLVATASGYFLEKKWKH